MGSGLNFKRKQFVQLMKRVEKGEVGEIIVAHKDRLVRFGSETFTAFVQGFQKRDALKSWTVLLAILANGMVDPDGAVDLARFEARLKAG